MNGIRGIVVRGIAMLACAIVVARAQAQTNNTATPLGRALMAERNGAYGDAATQYGAILASQPANVGALLGMEHMLPRLDRRAELVNLVERALAADSTGVGVLGVAVRTFATSNHADSARKYAERWSARAPGDEDPFREWAEAAMQARDLAQVKLALDLGRARLGPAALGIERAEMLQRSGDITGATQEWTAVVRATPAFREGAVSMLSQVRLADRPAVRLALQHDGSIEARQMLGLLVAGWGEPSQALSLIRSALPADAEPAKALLRALAERLRDRVDQPSRVAIAAALEAIADRESGPERIRAMTDAARAYADGGDERNARRILALLAANPAAAGIAAATSVTLMQVLVAEGKAAEADRTLDGVGDKIGPDEHDRLARQVAMLWVRKGDLDRADALILHDSSTAGFDLKGRLRAFRGDLAAANDLLKQAGPYDDQREQALDRITLLVLIQAIGRDSSAALGNALLALARGDSARAVAGLVALAETLKAGGAAETRFFAAQLALARRDTASAQQMFRLADVKDAPATAAAARLALARVSAAAGRGAEARTMLERLILDFPESAVVPEARRLRDTLRGAVPGGR